MDCGTVATIGSAAAAAAAWAATVVAWVGLKHARTEAGAVKEQAGIQKEQTDIQRDVLRQSREPYVWADIQQDRENGAALVVVVGNSGTTPARNVRVVITPSIPKLGKWKWSVEDVLRQLEEGILSIAPGREIRWPVGWARDHLNVSEGVTYRLRITADGPYGPIEPVELEARPMDWSKSTLESHGSIQSLTQAVGTLADNVRMHK